MTTMKATIDEEPYCLQMRFSKGDLLMFNALLIQTTPPTLHRQQMEQWQAMAESVQELVDGIAIVESTFPQ